MILLCNWEKKKGWLVYFPPTSSLLWLITRQLCRDSSEANLKLWRDNKKVGTEWESHASFACSGRIKGGTLIKAICIPSKRLLAYLRSGFLSISLQVAFLPTVCSIAPSILKQTETHLFHSQTISKSSIQCSRIDPSRPATVGPVSCLISSDRVLRTRSQQTSDAHSICTWTCSHWMFIDK